MPGWEGSRRTWDGGIPEGAEKSGGREENRAERRRQTESAGWFHRKHCWEGLHCDVNEVTGWREGAEPGRVRVHCRNSR